MCMHWLRYVRLNRKDWLKSMCGTTLEVAMIVYDSGAYGAIPNVYQCVGWAPLTRDFATLFKTLMAQPLNLEYLLWIMS